MYGRMVARAGDLDGDGVGDIAIGVPYHKVADMERAGRLEIRSGRTGEILTEMFGDQSERWLGWHIAPAAGIGRGGQRRGLLVSSVRHAIDGRPGVGAVDLLLYPAR